VQRVDAVIVGVAKATDITPPFAVNVPTTGFGEGD